MPWLLPRGLAERDGRQIRLLQAPALECGSATSLLTGGQDLLEHKEEQGFGYFTSLSVFSTPVCLTMCCEETFEVDHGTSALQFHSRSRYICSTVLPRKCSKRRSWLRVRCVQVSDFVQPAILLF